MWNTKLKGIGLPNAKKIDLLETSRVALKIELRSKLVDLLPW